MADNLRFSDYPKSKLCRQIRGRMIRKLLLAALWLVLWVTACTLWGMGHTEHLSLFNWILLGILIGACGWFIFGVGTILFDRPFEGTITAIKLRYVWHRAWLLDRRITKEPQISAIIDVGGKTIRYRFPLKDLEPKSYYLIGDRVRHYRGLPYLEREDKSDEYVLCLLCGEFTYFEEDRCDRCMAQLMK